MTNREGLWTLVQEAMQAFAPFYRDAMGSAIEESGVPEQWFALSLARGAHPAPFSVERFHALAPYTARANLAENLEALARLELLERVGAEAYRLTGPGMEAVEAIYDAAHRSISEVSPLPEVEMERLNDLLFRLVQATLEAREPREKWAIAYSRWADPGEGAAGSVLADQYLTDLLRYRDDAHIAAWKPYGVSGHAWEALTFVWRGEAHTAEKLAETLSARGHSAEVYADALTVLVARGWVEETPDGYRATEEGAALRQEAEDATNQHFFAPWASLSTDEVVALRGLLQRLRDSLRALAEGTESGGDAQ